MKCVDPYVKNGEAFSCGRCLPCAKVRAWTWCSRIMIEGSQHDYSSVVTLTYSEEALPRSGLLQPGHLCAWLKRIRARSLERYPWRHLRFYATGEYGGESGRPHYHVVLFGQPGCLQERSGRLWCDGCGCETCQDVNSTWSLGATSVDKLTRQSAMYVAGYVTRKLGRSLDGRKPGTFTRMSLRPGIGAGAMHDVASSVLQWKRGMPWCLEGPTGRLLLGRYLRMKLGEYSLGEIPAYAQSKAMCDVRNFAFAASRSHKGVYAELNEVYESQLCQKMALKEKVL